jgi:hypothetical protein
LLIFEMACSLSKPESSGLVVRVYAVSTAGKSVHV